MPDIFVTWYDNYGCLHDSSVYFVDEDKNFYWVSTGDCQLLKKTNR